MKYVKKALKTLGFLFLILALIILFFIIDDSRNTAYLKVNNSPELLQNSYLLKNVNVVPMHQDTVLKTKMVLIKDGVIDKIADTILIENTAGNIEVIDFCIFEWQN